MEDDLTSKSHKNSTTHEYFMGEALKEAKKAYKKDETPIGCVIVKEGTIIARGHNQKELKQDPTLHAEMIAIRKAVKKLGSWRLNECDMYVTLEPCPMCAGALIQARIRTVYIGTLDPKSGAVGSVINLLEIEKFNHRVKIHVGFLQFQCANILKIFFKSLRLRKSKS